METQGAPGTFSAISSPKRATTPATSYRRTIWIVFAVIVLVLSGMIAWYARRPGLPPIINIAAGPAGGLYHQVGKLLADSLQKRLNRPVRVIETAGSVQNRELLISGKADLAILQGGSVSPAGLVGLAPLYHDVLHVIVRNDRNINSMIDLAGRNVSIGPKGSGMRRLSESVLLHYHIDPATVGMSEHYFTDLKTDDKLDAAIVVTGLVNPDLQKVLMSGKFKLLPILSGEALATLDPSIEPATIPRGMFGETPLVPDQAIPSLAVTSYLAARPEASGRLVSAAMKAIYDDDMRLQIPVLIPVNVASKWDDVRQHPDARTYFDPFGGMSTLSDMVQGIDGVKELLFTLGAGVFLLWQRIRVLRHRREEEELVVLKNRLDDYVKEAMAIERSQMDTHDPVELERLVRGVSDIKLRAFEEFTNESLRGDRNFHIFLTECANLQRTMQAKMQLMRLSSHRPDLLAAMAKLSESEEE